MNQENVKEDNLPNKEKPKCNFFYFIDTHENKKNYKIYLPDDYEGKDSLRKIYQKEIKNLSSEVYSFKIIPGALKKGEDQNYKILILADDEEGNKYQNVIKKTMDSPDNQNLIVSTSRLFENEDIKYTFTFYFLIFLECFNTKKVQEFFMRFKPEKIEGLGVFPESRVRIIQNRLNIISKNPEKCLYLKDAKDEVEMIELFYPILLYFNMNYQKEKVEEMLKDDKILTFLSKKLISFANCIKI